jgi:CRISPR-associated protein Csm2
MQQRHQQNRNRDRSRHDSPVPKLDTAPIRFAEKSPELFDRIADETAQTIAQGKDKHKKSTQLRKFYDEIGMWDQKISQNRNSYPEYLPLIKMINAKVAYAKGRDLVDNNFPQLMRHCLDQIDEKPESFETFKLFFEAFMGFYKMYKPK